MNNEKMNQIIDEVYENYVSTYENFEWTDDFCEKNLKDCGDQWDILSKEDFINNCKTDDEFSKTWGLRIEERELSFEERDDLRLKLILDYLNKKGIISASFEDFKRDEDIIPNIDWRREVREGINWIDYGNEVKRNRLEEIYEDIKNIPTKLITITYNDIKTEIYE